MTGFYSAYLALHTWNRWAVLAVTLAAVLASFWGWKTRQPYGRGYRLLAWTSVWISSLQSFLGFTLYFYYDGYQKALWNSPGASMKNPDIRFFGVEHALAMFMTIGFVHLGAARARKSKDDQLSHRWLAWSHTAALAVMVLAVPWWRPWWS